MHIAHFSPTFFSPESVVGGGEKYVNYMCTALRMASKDLQMHVSQTTVSFGARLQTYPAGEMVQGLVLQGEPWNHSSLDAAQIRNVLHGIDVVVVHQCLHPFGLFIAAQAKLMGKTVVGMDHGGGEHPIVNHSPEVGHIFDWFLAQSNFCAGSFHDLDAQVEIIKGPVDTSFFHPDNRQKNRDSVIMIGRLLPHKGHDTVIRCLPEGLKLKIIGSRYDETYWNFLQSEIGGKTVEIVDGLSDEAVLDELRSAGLAIHPSTHFDYQRRHYPKPELLGLAPLEALASGTPVIVSNAAALPELASLTGCWSFASEAELTSMLENYARGSMVMPPSHEIAADVDRHYGPLQFGKAVLQKLKETA